MDNTIIKERICNLLELIVDRTESINSTKSSDCLIDVDLVIEDLKQLYKEFNLLKKVTEEQLEYEKELSGKDQLCSKDPASRTFPRTFITPPPDQEKKKEVEEPIKDEPKSPVVEDEKEDKADESHQGDADSTIDEDQSAEESDPEIKTDKAETQQTGDVSIKETPSEKTEGSDLEQEQKVDEEQSLKPEETAKKAEKKSKNNTSIAETVGKNQNKTIGDKYVKEEDTSLNVRLAKMKQEVTIGTRMQHKPISNLKDSIGVNEKFLFINELFEGDIDAYNDAINKLNSFKNIDEAFEYINQLNESYSWDKHHSSGTIDKFAYLVQRRYMTN